MNTKPLESITIEELQEYPVWRFVSKSGDDDTCLVPVKCIPCSDLKGKIVATKVTLANGAHVWAFLGSIDPSNPILTQHFVTISVHSSGKWFHLARYHDYDYDERGPRQLAEFLGLNEHDVFPISYDVTRYVTTADIGALAGTIERESKIKLSRAEIIALAVP